MTNINTFQGDVFIHEYIKHTGDDNNLFGFSGTDTFKIATAGTDRLTIDASGLVGIGTSDPKDITHIFEASTSQTTGLLIEKQNSGSGCASILFGTAASNESSTGKGKAGIFFERTAANGRGKLHFLNDSVDDANGVAKADTKMTILNNGYVGIGLEQPINKLHVDVGTASYEGIHLSTTNTGFAKLIGNAGDGGHNSLVKSGDTGIVFSPDGSSTSTASGKGFYITPWANTTSGLKILDSGNVGIGVALPAYPLDVNGVIRGGCPVFFQRSSGNNTGTGSTVNFNRQIYGVGFGSYGFNISTDKFYAPIAGYYHLIFGCMSNFGNGVHAYRFRLNGSDHPYSTQDARVYGYIEGGTGTRTYMRLCGSTVMYLGVGQYAEILNEPNTSSIHESYNQFTGFYLST